MPERMKMIVEGAGNCLMDVSEAHKIWLKKLPRVNGRLDPSLTPLHRLAKNVEMSIQQVNMPERMKMIIEWTGQCIGS